ncbi:RNA polymerase subunit sigma-24 [Rhodococcoides trifolii]|uniref:RNA polymerase subunit sigma-24 n=1 Tax=Rhodococcoides trifolii TaxID=908250 RepID=A0A917CQ93_9NOCA|nr:DUF6596 domain-containing protein [Rhodococcus trifolii]GGF95894.1 RNA polymerase subunit sigma-24 [Rhodococcus trifolii]
MHAGEIEAVFREERGRLLASLVAQYRDLDLAEDVTSDALEAALVHWPVDGVPSRPGAWLLTAARRKALDIVRRDTVYANRIAQLAVDVERADPVQHGDEVDLPDDRLQLFFTCAHPALAVEDRLVLTLRCLAGLTTPEVARALLLTPATAGQRVVRAKKKISQSRIPFRVPGADELPSRLPLVLQVVYSVFTEGYSASSGEDLMRIDLAEEAIGLGRVLHRLMPDSRNVSGLLALMLLVHARRGARTDPDGDVVLLADQDRSLWDTDAIAEGTALVERALNGGPPGRYAVQAAIAALHDEAADAASTDWPQIVALYEVLTGLAPSPIVAMNHAVAVAMCDGPQRGLELLDELRNQKELARYYPFPLARADLLQKLGRDADAVEAYRVALACVVSTPVREMIERRLATVRR